jgi:PKD repeat protein
VLCDPNFNLSIDTTNGIVNFYSPSISLFPNKYFWIFGDGDTSSANPVIHHYKKKGDYAVYFAVTSHNQNNSVWCQISTYKIINIPNTVVCAASVAFTMAPDSSAALTWNVTPVYLPTTASAIWYWGDGTSTSGFNPSHTYTIPGIYNICVAVTDTCGAIDTACITSNIMKSSNSSGLIYTVNVVSNFMPISSLSVKNIINDNIKLNIYPNPNNGSFKIESSAKGEYKILNSLGKEIKSIYLDGKNDIDLSLELSNGIYCIVGSSSGISRKMVVSK